MLYSKNDYIKYTIMRWTYSGIKQKEIGYVLITGSTYRLHDAIIDVSPRIGENLTNQNYIDNVHLEG